MDPLLVVIITFGLIFVVTASLGNGLSITVQSVMGPLKAHKQLNVMLLLSNFIVLPALLIGLAAILPFEPQVKMAIAALALRTGAPFIPWLVGLAKGNLGYSVGAVILLTLATFIVLPLALPIVLNLLGTGATPSMWLVLWPMLLFMLLPLVVGMVIRARYANLAMQIGAYLGPISITFLVVHICLFLGYTWKDVVSLAGGGVLAFALVFPLAGMLIGYLLSPPYVLSPVPAARSTSRLQDRLDRCCCPAEYGRRYLLCDLCAWPVHSCGRHDPGWGNHHDHRCDAGHGGTGCKV